ncbi:MAG TPA: glycosyltransferase family 2 protein [Ferruginibacter sp.]|nr:glycosyltransferase family 2 protein [Ferruginibacter sp.]
MGNHGISVIIPNYNGRHILPQVLPSLMEALINSGLPYEVIVSDDCSDDQSVDYLHENFPLIITIENKMNRGFSPTINMGIQEAKYEYVLLLNSDVKLSPDYFSGLMRYFDRDDTFGVMGRIIGWNDDEIQDAAKYPRFAGAKIKTTGNYYASTPKKTDWLYSMYLSGANALVSRSKLLALGGFDEIFAPFYVEDFEISLRAWRLGWKCYYEHFAVCRHQTSLTIKSKSSKTYINSIYYRNKMFLHAIHLSGFHLFLWYIQLLPETIIRLLTLRFYYLRSLKYFFRNRKRASQSRQKFVMLGQATGMMLNVQQVVTVIKRSLKNVDIKRF